MLRRGLHWTRLAATVGLASALRRPNARNGLR